MSACHTGDVSIYPGHQDLHTTLHCHGDIRYSYSSFSEDSVPDTTHITPLNIPGGSRVKFHD
jgi:hypothetical protein